MRKLFTIILLLFSGLLVSCLKDKPESLPEKLEWNPGLAFPVGIDRFGLNAESGFDTTLFELDTLTGLPEWVGRVEVTMTGRVDFDLSAFNSNNEEIKQILFRVGLFNGFPHEVLAQAYFIDEGENLIDSMFSDGAIPLPPGTPILNEEIINPSKLIVDAVFGEERIQGLYQSTEIILKAVIANPEIDTTLIPYYRQYYIDMELGILTDLTLTF